MLGFFSFFSNWELKLVLSVSCFERSISSFKTCWLSANRWSSSFAWGAGIVCDSPLWKARRWVL